MDTSNLTELKELSVDSLPYSSEFLPSGLNSQLKRFTGDQIELKSFRRFFSLQNKITELTIRAVSSDYETMKIICGMKKLKKLTIALGKY